jgi:phosphatidylcholine synthase
VCPRAKSCPPLPPPPAGRVVSAGPESGGAGRARAWFAHALTASGGALGLLALVAVADGAFRTALLLLAAAVAVDAVDGAVARWARVRETLPAIDGALLDNLVDFLTYVVVPAFLLVRAPILPPGWALPAACAMLLASGFQFSRTDAKTEDHFFTGFPSYWNIVVMYLLLLPVGAWEALAVVVALCVLVFVPFRYVYPSRTVRYRPLTLAATAAWGLICLVEIVRYPMHSTTMLGVSLLYVPFYLGVSVLARRRPHAAV